MAEIGILGRRERAGTFSALGVRPYYAETARQAQALRCRDRVLPAVLFLPGSGVAAEEALQEAVRRALGTDAV